MDIVYPEPLIWLITINAALFGAIVGSFLNVCIHRLPTGYLSIVTPPSHCPHCGTQIHWYDNIPLVSWILLGGACRYCRNPISIRYMLVEAGTAILFTIYTRWILLLPLPAFAGFTLVERWFVLIVALYLIGHMIVITFIDIAYRIIPDSLTYPGVILAPLVSAIYPVLHVRSELIANPHLSGFIASILGIVVGGGSLYLVGFIGKIIFRKEAMGFGDVKMMAMVGGLLGWDCALIIFLLACVFGTVIGIFSFVITRDRYTPFGPFLALGTLITFLFKQQIVYMFFTAWPEMIARWLGMNLSVPYGF